MKVFEQVHLKQVVNLQTATTCLYTVSICRVAAKLTVVLDDINDNPPVFTPSGTYTAQISEASQSGLNVKQLLATDADKDSTPIKYYIIHNTEQSNVFKITDANRESGVITLNKTVDHERDHWINFTVLAVDSGTPALSATANVAVEIKDINDNSPEWRTLENTVDVWENATVGTEVTTVWAVDRDSDEFSKVMYFIKDGAFGKFHINNKTVSFMGIYLVILLHELFQQES